jgi:hypothetical protein
LRRLPSIEKIPTVTAEQVEVSRMGHFWLPDSLERRHPGYVDLSGPWPQIIVQGQMLSPVSETVVEQGAGQEDETVVGLPAHEFPTDRVTIHGTLSSGSAPRHVTLVDAWVHRSTGLQLGGPLGAGADNGEQGLRGAWLVHGAHVTSDQRVTGARVRFTHIDEWAGDSGITSLKYVPSVISGVDLVYRRPEPKEVTLPEGGLTMRVTHLRRLHQPTVTGMHVEHHAYLEFTNIDCTLPQLLSEHVQPALHLASLMLDHHCTLTDLRVTIDESGQHRAVHHPLVREDRNQSPLRPEGRHPIRLPQVGIDAFARGVQALRAVAPIPAIVTANLAPQPGQYIESRLLELAAAAEGLDRRMHGPAVESEFSSADAKLIRNAAVDMVVSRMGRVIQDIAVDGVLRSLGPVIRDYAAEQVREKLAHFEPSYRNRLLRLLDYTEPIVPEAAGAAAHWARTLTGARNDYAHLLLNSRNDFDTDMVQWESLRWILRAALMRWAGFPDEVQRAKIVNNPSYMSFTRSARHYAHTIYDDSRDEDSAAK